ncbi:MAG: 50S ribosomal protein L31, partial [Chloroflexia bacterium]|nr:50S ribosomal protein L31 [Chloroflexia bacterium]
ASQDRQAAIEKQRTAKNQPQPKKSLLKELYGDDA